MLIERDQPSSGFSRTFANNNVGEGENASFAIEIPARFCGGFPNGTADRNIFESLEERLNPLKLSLADYST